MKLRHHSVLLSGLAVLSIQATWATNISGTISSTLTITQNSQLTGDVTCTVTGNPCIQFGASGIELQLNGHTMTGNGSRNICTFSAGEDGIFTNGQNAVSIEGPGIVRRFRQRGIEVTGNDSIVKHVTVLSSCLEGIVVAGHHNIIKDNSIARASVGTNFDASIWVQGTGSHVILHNEISASGAFTGISGSAPFPAGGGQGIFVGIGGGTPSTNNIIQENNSSGIPGSGLFFTAGSTGNHVVRNQFLGNLIFDDIFDFFNAVGANDYDDNLCEVSRVGPSSINVCEIPNISGHKNPDEEDN